MSKRSYVPIADLDVFFLSFDEPKAEAFFADLQAKHPKARRIHGVKGFDAAHKAAARASKSEYFVTVDADNIVERAFFELQVDRAWLQPSTLISWPARNAVNGLVYGNGALKIWPREFVLNMKTHELAVNHEGSVDFVYNNDLEREGGPFHLDMSVAMSTVFANSTPLMAFRSGFRAALRLTVLDGYPTLKDLGTDAIDPSDRHRLALWLNLGVDAEHGLWTIFGARLGCAMGNFGKFDLKLLNDLDWFESFFRTRLAPIFQGRSEFCGVTGYGYDRSRLVRANARLGASLRRHGAVPTVELDAAASALFKRHYTPPPLTSFDRMGNMFRRGVGVEVDEQAALASYQAAAATGDGNAMRNLAHHLITNRSVGRDYRRAAALLQEAAACDNVYALERLARLHLSGFGWGIDKDPEKALQHLRRSADLGFPKAAVEAARLLVSGEMVAQDRARAAVYMAFAALKERQFTDEALRLQEKGPQERSEG